MGDGKGVDGVTKTSRKTPSWVVGTEERGPGSDGKKEEETRKSNDQRERGVGWIYLFGFLLKSQNRKRERDEGSLES